jgi:hypothetical protein
MINLLKIAGVCGVLLLLFSCLAAGRPLDTEPENANLIDGFEDKLEGWSAVSHSGITIDYSTDAGIAKEGTRSLKLEYNFTEKKPFFAFMIKDLGNGRDWARYDSISLWSYVPKAARELSGLSVMVFGDDGSEYLAQNVRDLKKTGWELTSIPFSEFIRSKAGGGKDRFKLNSGKVKKVAVGIYQPFSVTDKSFTVYIDHIVVYRDQGVSSRGTPPAPTPEKASETHPGVVVDFGTDVSGWKKNIVGGVSVDYSFDGSITKMGKKSMKMEYTFDKKEPFAGYLEKELGSSNKWEGADTLNFWTYIPEAAKELIDLSVMLYEKDGSAYIAQHARGLKTTGWQEASIPFSKFYLAGSWTKDENDSLDLDQIRKISIGIYQPMKFSDEKFVIYIDNIRTVRSGTARASETARSAPVVRTNKLQKFEPPDGKVYHGVWVFKMKKGWGSDRSDWENQIDEKELAEYEKLSGRPAEILSFAWFLDWEFPTEMCKKIDRLGKIPHLGVTTRAIKLSDIISGKIDGKIAEWARAAKDYGKPVFIRFLAEMNGNWNSYSEAYDPSQTHSMYITAWRHVYNGFRKAGVTNLAWVWAPTSVDTGNVHWTDYYPGDDYVDWVGVSVYSFLGNGDPEQQILGVYNDYAARKPVMIAESAAGDADDNPSKYQPGSRYFDNPEKWINRYFDTLESKAPRVKAFVWFNIEQERVWRIQESQAKIDVYKKRLSNKRYNARLK